MAIIKSSGHPQFVNGVGNDIGEAIIDYVEKNSEKSPGLKNAFDSALGEDYKKYIETHSGKDALEKIQESGSYGPIELEE